MQWLTSMNKAIAGLIVPLVTYLITVGVLPEMQEGMSPNELAMAISSAITAIVVWLVPNSKGGGQ